MMQTVILTAGRGARMGDVTAEIPKPLLPVAGKTLLEYKFDAMPEEIDEILIVVGWMGEKIQERFGTSYKNMHVRYIEQETLDGTMGALSRTKDILTGRFLVMMGDDIYSREDAEKCLRNADGWSLLVQKSYTLRAGGNVQIDSENKVIGILEGEHSGPRLACTNMFVLDTRIFQFPMVPKATGSAEFGLPQTVVAAAKSLNVPLYAIPATLWIQITSAEDIQRAEEMLGKAAL